MRLKDRLQQLHEFGIAYRVLDIIGKTLSEEDVQVVARFDQSGGIEYVSRVERGKTWQIDESDLGRTPQFKVLVTEIGAKKAKRLVVNHGDPNCLSPLLGVETHTIFDREQNLKYSFEMPSRRYLS